MCALKTAVIAQNPAASIFGLNWTGAHGVIIRAIGSAHFVRDRAASLKRFNGQQERVA
jgi:hypothetical protein